MEKQLQLIIKSPQATQPTTMLGSGKNFRGVPEPGDYTGRPLMINAWSQTTCIDFSILKECEQDEHRSKREEELEKKIKVLEENLKAHTELLAQIYTTSAKTSALLGQHNTYSPPHSEQETSAISYNTNYYTGPSTSRAAQISPMTDNSSKNSSINCVMNPLQQVNCSPVDSVKYTIIAEGSGNNNGEPIEIQLAEEDGALNLNSSADSGRLEICLAPEDNVDVKTEVNGDNTAIINQPLQTTTTPNEEPCKKKRKITPDQNKILTDNTPSTSTANIENNKNTKKRGSYTKKGGKRKNSSSEYYGIGIDNVLVSIGPNNSRVPADLYESIAWDTPSIATRKLLMALFDRETLATHSMTGKPSPAFKNSGKPLKEMLNPLITSDIIFAVTHKCKAPERRIRSAITTKCADENKMMKSQLSKQQKEMNKENIAE